MLIGCTFNHYFDGFIKMCSLGHEILANTHISNTKLPSTTSSWVVWRCWVALIAAGMELDREEQRPLFPPSGHRLSKVCLVTWSNVPLWCLMLVATAKTAGGPPSTSNGLFERMFCVSQCFIIVLAELLLCAVFICLFLLLSAFVLM